MTQEQINKLISDGEFPEKTGKRELIETHISWVILCDKFVYKIKKPVHYSFLDFSTPELRKFYCHREIELNRRLTPDVYLEVLPIRESSNKIIVGSGSGTIIEHAVKMKKLDTSKQMDRLLIRQLVTNNDMRNLAEKITSFHKETDIIYDKNLSDIREEFNDLETEKEYLGEQLGERYKTIIEDVIGFSDRFLGDNKKLMEERLRDGYYRDCHGDLHSRNIFLLPEPVPFDCIEFNDDFRQIDVLNEVAFLCMDLDAFNHEHLSDKFLEYYNQFFPVIKNEEEHQLFIYYKSYRANIRAKVNSLRAKSATTDDEKSKALATSEKYLIQMAGYVKKFEIPFNRHIFP